MKKGQKDFVIFYKTLIPDTDEPLLSWKGSFHKCIFTSVQVLTLNIPPTILRRPVHKDYTLYVILLYVQSALLKTEHSLYEWCCTCRFRKSAALGMKTSSLTPYINAFQRSHQYAVQSSYSRSTNSGSYSCVYTFGAPVFSCSSLSVSQQNSCSASGFMIISRLLLQCANSYTLILKAQSMRVWIVSA